MTRPYPENNGSLTISMVLHWSCLATVQVTLESLVIALQKAGMVGHITVVDQSLDRHYARRAKALCGRVCNNVHIDYQFLTTGDNRGYGAGHNRVLPDLHSDLHLILNPDVKIHEGALTRVVEAFQARPNLTLLAPRGIDEQGTEECLAKAYPSVLVLALRAFGPRWLCQRFNRQLQAYELRHLSTAQGLHSVPLVSGCCMWLRSEAFVAVGWF